MDCGLAEDVADLRFEFGVESNVAETEPVLVMLRLLSTPEAAKKSGLVPDEPAKTQCAQAHSEEGQR